MKMIGEIDTMEEEYNTKVKELNNEKTNCKACETYISKPNFYDGIPCKEHIDKKDKLEAEYTTPYGIHRIVLNSIIKKILEKLIQQDGIERSDIGDKQ
jgi:hypothetical protein